MLTEVSEFLRNMVHAIMDQYSLVRLEACITSLESKFQSSSSHNALLVSFGILVNIGLAWLSFFLYQRQKKKNKKEIYERALQLIADELVFNACRLLTMLMRPNWRPYGLLRHSCKDALWRKVLDILTDLKEVDASRITLIEKLYSDFEELNRQLDILFFQQGITAPIYPQTTLPLARPCPKTL